MEREKKGPTERNPETEKSPSISLLEGQNEFLEKDSQYTHVVEGYRFNKRRIYLFEI